MFGPSKINFVWLESFLSERLSCLEHNTSMAQVDNAIRVGSKYNLVLLLNFF